RFVCFGARRLKRVGREAQFSEAIDHAGGIGRARRPLDGDALVSEVDARACDRGHGCQAALDLAHAARAVNTLDREFKTRGAAVPAQEMGEIARLAHRAAYLRNTRVLERNTRSPARSAASTRSHWPGATSAALPP